MVHRRSDFVLPVAIATLGNCLGACTTSAIARAMVHLTPMSGSNRPRAVVIFERYGAPALLLSWIPVIGDAIVAIAGASQMRFLVFSVWTTVGKAVRYAIVARLALSV